MSYQYEVTVEAHLWEVFRMMANHVLERQGFRAGLHVPSLGGIGMMEYHRDDDVVTFSTTDEAHDLRRVTLRSETVEVAPLVMSVVEQLAIDVTASFWAPVTGVSRERLAQGVHQALASALEQAGRGGESVGDQ